MGAIVKMNLDAFVGTHEAQLRLSAVPQLLWPTLLRKLTAEVFDSGSYFTMMEEEDDDGETQLSVLTTQPLLTTDPDAVFLVDHAWTFRAGEARTQLAAMPPLLERMANLLGVCYLENPTEEVLAGIWTKAQTYSIQAPGFTAEEKLPLWYVMDEFGSAIGHSDEPNFRLVPFFFSPSQTSFSILFPVRNTDADEAVCRDYVGMSKERRAEWRDLYLIPWREPESWPSDCDNRPVPDDIFTAGRSVETVPEGTGISESGEALEKKAKVGPSGTFPIKVWAENPQITAHLSSEFFAIVATMEEADVLWWTTHFTDFQGLSTEWAGKLVNQFAFEATLTVKDLLAATLQAAFPPNGPAWLPRTFCLNRELPNFIAEFKRREKELGADNTWIVKPWNLARALDTHVANSLPQIIRLIDSGPKVACKYLDNSLLFQRPDSGAKVKMDLRFIVLLRSAEPLSLYIFNGFWIRFAIKEFGLSELDDYERHFTVFNYADKSKILQMRCSSFITSLEAQYPGLLWADVEAKIRGMLVQLFAAGTRAPPPRGLLPNAQSRALYGVDVMLEWDPEMPGEVGGIHPELLEVNFMPDCERACEYYPEFADAVFLTLFGPQPDDHPHAAALTKLA